MAAMKVSEKDRRMVVLKVYRTAVLKVAWLDLDMVEYLVISLVDQ